MASFHEVLFPLDIALKSAGGPERKTEIVTLGSGRENDTQLARLMIQQQFERIQNPAVGDDMEVVEDQDHRTRENGQAGADVVGGVQVETDGRNQLTQTAVGRDGTVLCQRTEHVEPEDLRVVVRVVQG